MEEAQLIAIVVGLVGYLKMQSSKVTGLWVPPIAVAVGVVVAFVYAASVPATGAIALETLKLGVKIGLAAVGGMHALLYGATKVGEAVKGQTGPA